MELAKLDYVKMRHISQVVEEATTKIEAITGVPCYIRLLGDAPLKTSEEKDEQVKMIMEITANVFGVSVKDLKGQSKKRPLPDARGIAMMVIRDITRLSYKTIGLYFGGRDHSTVHVRIHDTIDLMKYEPDLVQKLSMVTTHVNITSIYENERGSTATA